MAVTLVGSIGTASGTSPLTASYGQSPSAGHLLVAVVSWWSTAVETFAPTASAGWYRLIPAAVGNNGAGTSHAGCDVWYRIASGGDAAPVFTQTSGATALTACVIYELAGANSPAPLDTSGSYQSGSASLGAPPTMTPVTGGNLAQPGEFAVSAFVQSNQANVTQTWTELGSGYTSAFSDSSTNQSGHSQHNYQAGLTAGATLSDSGHFSSGTTLYDAAVIAVISPDPGPAPVNRYLPPGFQSPASFLPLIPAAPQQVNDPATGAVQPYFIGSTVNTVTGGTLTIPVVNPVNRGDAIVVCATSPGFVPFLPGGVTDSKSNTYRVTGAFGLAPKNSTNVATNTAALTTADTITVHFNAGATVKNGIAMGFPAGMIPGNTEYLDVDLSCSISNAASGQTGSSNSAGTSSTNAVFNQFSQVATGTHISTPAPRVFIATGVIQAGGGPLAFGQEWTIIGNSADNTGVAGSIVVAWRLLTRTFTTGQLVLWANQVTATLTGTLELVGLMPETRFATGPNPGPLILPGYPVPGPWQFQPAANGFTAAYSGFASGALALAATATGTRSESGAGTGALTLTGTATGSKRESGSGTGALALTASSAGHKSESGSGTGALTLAASASGSRQQAGTGTGSLVLSAIATGFKRVVSAVAGLLGLSATATGVMIPPPPGGATITPAGPLATITVIDGAGPLAAAAAMDGAGPLAAGVTAGAPPGFAPGTIGGYTAFYTAVYEPLAPRPQAATVTITPG